jgi:hypothetical protein
VLARQARRAVVLVWVGLVALVAAGQLADSVNALMLIVLTVDTVLLLALLAVAMLHNQRAAVGISTGPMSVGSGVPAAPGADGYVEGDGQLRR